MEGKDASQALLEKRVENIEREQIAQRTDIKWLMRICTAVFLAVAGTYLGLDGSAANAIAPYLP